MKYVSRRSPREEGAQGDTQHNRKIAYLLVVLCSLCTKCHTPPILSCQPVEPTHSNILHYFTHFYTTMTCPHHAKQETFGVMKKTWASFNINVLYCQYMKSHHGYKMVLRTLYLHNGNPYISKIVFSYWNAPQYFLWLSITACGSFMFDENWG